MSKMWRPTSIGDVIAERECALKRGRRRVGTIQISFGRPVRSPTPVRGDPWWCPVRIAGPSFDELLPVGGVDSLQALILALEYATMILPQKAIALGGQIEWLENQERVIFARQGLSHAAEDAIVSLIGRLKSAAAVLDSGDRSSGAERRRAMKALAAIGASVGLPLPPHRSNVRAAVRRSKRIAST